MAILLLEDKLGITEGYQGIFESLMLGAGLNPQQVRRYSVWKSPVARSHKLLIQKGNRKSPGFNPDPRVAAAVREFLDNAIDRVNPELILCLDLAMLGIVEPRWDIATIDNLRGGVYFYRDIPFLVTTPFSAVHTQKKAKDVRALNQGYETKEAFDAAVNSDDESEDDPAEPDEEEDKEIFIAPYTIPYGNWILRADLRKAHRLIQSGVRKPHPQIRLCLSAGDVSEARDFLSESILLANDIETNPELGLMTVDGYSGLLESGEIRSYVFPLYAGKSHTAGTPVHLPQIWQTLIHLSNLDTPVIYQNGAYDCFWKVRYGIPPKNYAYDTMSMFWAIFPELPKRLDFISSIMLDDYQYWKGDRKSDDFTTYLLYNGRDCDRTLRSGIRLIDLLIQDERSRLNFQSAHNRVLAALGMSLRGMRVSTERMAAHGAQLEQDAAARLERLRYVVADPEFNPNSPKQKSELIYRKLGARPRTAKGRIVSKIEDGSTGAIALRAIRSDHPLFKRVANSIMESMEPAKQISNIINMRLAKWPNGQTRFYTGYNGVGTNTSRLSSTSAPINVGTNGQNFRKTYRDVLIPDPGHFLLEGDLSAGDDVFVTFESGDPHKIELFRSGRDAHSQNATLFFPNWTYDAVRAGKAADDPRVIHPITGIRQITKKLSHGCNYLMAALTLLMTAGREAIVAAAKEVGFEDAGYWSQERLAEFCVSREELYRNHYTRFKRSGPESWYTDLQSELIATGGFTTPFHYFQRFLGDNRDPNIIRAVAATAGQAGTAGRINMAMDELILGNIPKSFRDAPNPDADAEPLVVSRAEHGISLRLQTHDSLTFDVDPEHPGWEEGADRIFRVMRRPVVIRNKLTGLNEHFIVGSEFEAGFAWGKGLHGLRENSVQGIKLALGLAS